MPVIAGTGANSTAEAIELTAYAKKAGARAGAVGRAVLQQADAGRPVPALPHHRRGGRPAADPLQRARAHGRRPGQRHRAAARAGAQHRRHQGRDRRPGARHSSSCGGCPTDAASRSTPATTPRRCRYMLLGGHGVISVTANVAPRLMHDMCAAALAGDLARPRAAQQPADAAATRNCSSRPTRFRSSGRWREMGLIETRAAPAADAAVRRRITTTSAPRCAKRAVSRLIPEGTSHAVLKSRRSPRAALLAAAVLLLAGCETVELVRRARRSTTSRRAPRAGARDPARPDRRPQSTTATPSPTASGAAARDADAAAAQTRRPDRAEPDARARASSARAPSAGWWSRPRPSRSGPRSRAVLDRLRASCWRSSSRGRADGDRLGGEPRRHSGRTGSAARLGKVHRPPLLDLRARQVPHARSSAAASRARSRSTSSTAAWSRCRRPRSTTRRRPRSRGR